MRESREMEREGKKWKRAGMIDGGTNKEERREGRRARNQDVI